MKSEHRVAVYVRSLFAHRSGILSAALAVICAAGLPGSLWGQDPWTIGSGVISYTGNVGIGTTTPAYPLDVTGTVHASGGFQTTNYTASATVNSPADVRENFFNYSLTGASTNWFIGFGNWVSTTTDYSNPTFIEGIENALRLGFAGGSVGGTVASAVAQNTAVVVNTGSTVTSARGMDVAVTATGGAIIQGKGINITEVDGASNNRWGIYDSSGAPEYFAGPVGIGTTVPCGATAPTGCAMSVNGAIQAKEVIVNANWSDYVFDSGYRNRPLAEVAAYIRENHHLPDIPSAQEVEEKGVSLGDMQAKLLAKIEEITLHMIQAEDRNDRLEQRNNQLDQQNRGLQERLARLEAHTAH